MRKLKLQMQITVDGFVAGPQGQLDWMTWNMDEELIAFINHLTDTSDTILLGRKMTEGFVNYWEQVITQPESAEYAFGRKMVDTSKIVFSKTLSHMHGQNVAVENAPVVDAVNRLKSASG
jgi:dihydrofolate reductase